MVSFKNIHFMVKERLSVSGVVGDQMVVQVVVSSWNWLMVRKWKLHCTIIIIIMGQACKASANGKPTLILRQLNQLKV